MDRVNINNENMKSRAQVSLSIAFIHLPHLSIHLCLTYSKVLFDQHCNEKYGSINRCYFVLTLDAWCLRAEGEPFESIDLLFTKYLGGEAETRLRMMIISLRKRKTLSPLLLEIFMTFVLKFYSSSELQLIVLVS